MPIGMYMPVTNPTECEQVSYPIKALLIFAKPVIKNKNDVVEKPVK